MPWTYHPDLHKNFTGFFSEKNMYGTPGKFLVIFSVLCILFLFINKVWIKFTHLFLAGIILAYAIKSFQLYTSTYYGITPEKLPGIYLLLFFAVLNFAIAMLPKMKIDAKK